MDSVELLLDLRAEKLLNRDWALLKEAELPSQGNHTGPSNRPHITVLAAPRIPAEHDQDLAMLADALPLSIHNAGLVIFRTGRGQVLTRLGVVSGALLKFHRSVHEILRDVPDVAGNCKPDRWIPHVTLARGMTSAQVGRAVDLLPADHGELRAVTLRRWDSHARTTTPLASGQDRGHQDECRHCERRSEDDDVPCQRNAPVVAAGEQEGVLRSGQR